jgi:hypothetical protein
MQQAVVFSDFNHPFLNYVFHANYGYFLLLIFLNNVRKRVFLELLSVV